MKSKHLFEAIILPLAALCTLTSCNQDKGYYNLSGFAQGGTWRVTLNVDSNVTKTPQELKEGIDSILLVIDNAVSGYNKSSMLSRFNAGDTVEVNNMFTDIYKRSYAFWEETEGAVDVAAGPLFNIWGFGFTKDSLPAPDKVRELIHRCGIDRLVGEMVLSKGKIHGSMLVKKGETEDLPSLNYNCVAQGYSSDVVADWLRRNGVTDMLVDVGGEIYVNGFNQSGKGWVLGIDRPEDGNQVAGEKIETIFETDGKEYGIVTSGNYRKFYVHDGHKYAHTIDPRTGYPVEHHLLSATIISPDATSADAYATYCMVIGFEAARDFINSREDLEGCLIYDDNGTMTTWTSQGIILR